MEGQQRGVSGEQQHSDQVEGSLSTPCTDGSEARPSSTAETQHQDQPCIQEETQLKQTQITQNSPSQENKLKETQQSQEIQKEDHGKIAHESQEQEIPTTGQTHHTLPSSEHQNKPLTQNQKPPQNPQQGKDQQQRQQEQQIKKLKKKLVGENQECINFLVQASQAMAVATDSSGAVTGQRALAAQVGSLASAVGRRCVLRLAPALKRCLCKGCGTALVYGLNARVRHRSRRQKHLVVTCLACHTIKRFVNNPKHKLWFEQEEALA